MPTEDAKRLKDWRQRARDAAAPELDALVSSAPMTPAAPHRGVMDSLMGYLSQFHGRARTDQRPQLAQDIEKAQEAKRLDEWELATTGRMSRDVELPAMSSLRRGR